VPDLGSPASGAAAYLRRLQIEQSPRPSERQLPYLRPERQPFRDAVDALAHLLEKALESPKSFPSALNRGLRCGHSKPAGSANAADPCRAAEAAETEMDN
jgi:hypothetical protein